ncbi:MAG TPA: response regulator transcription factor, partial [Gemmatimonadales bacterium]|nr:response regulator transcription factor [Gemmatimonadales bacterium]
VLLADDHSVVRAGLRHVLAGDPELTVVGEAGTGPDAMVLAAAERPDVVLLDLTMPGAGGLEVLRHLRATLPEIRVLILSVHDDQEYVLESVRAGAHGYLRKDSSPAEIRQAVRAVCAGDAYFSPPVARHLTTALRDATPAPEGDIAALTSREREVLVRVARGLTNRETASELRISVRTVEAHRDSLMRKLRIHTVAGLTRFAISQGLLPASQ